MKKVVKWHFKAIKQIDNIVTGDMPGDKIDIKQNHIINAQKIAQKLEVLFADMKDVQEKVVVSVYGGSGVGKSETASLIGHILNQNGFGTYILSGDNYPKRIPRDNDRERMRVFRESALKGLIDKDKYDETSKRLIAGLVSDDIDCDESLTCEYSFLNEYINEGKKGLAQYLGTPLEINFDEINEIIESFKNGKDKIMLRRMGRTEKELWYDDVDMHNVDVLIIEWTHGNNEHLEGVDIPILLNSTPEETLEHRKSRGRDKGVDSPFIKMVLEIEQQKIFQQTKTAKIIITKNGEIISYEEYLKFIR